MIYQATKTSGASVAVNEADDGSISCFEIDDAPFAAITSKMSTPTSDDKPMVINLDNDGSCSSCLEMDDTPIMVQPRRNRLKFSQRQNSFKVPRRSSLDNGLLQKAKIPSRRKLLDRPAVVSPNGSASSIVFPIEMGDAPPTIRRRMRFSNKANKPKERKVPSSESRVKPFMVKQDSLSCFELLDESVASVRSSVSFSTSAEEHVILNLGNLSSEEKESIWYQEEELSDIREAVDETLRLRRKGGLLDPEEHCFQGLGPRTKKGAKERHSRLQLSLSCVLNEQKRQANNGIKNPLRIAQLYQSFSQASEKIAIVSAERIARDKYMTERSVDRLDREE